MDNLFVELKEPTEEEMNELSKILDEAMDEDLSSRMNPHASAYSQFVLQSDQRCAEMRNRAIESMAQSDQFSCLTIVYLYNFFRKMNELQCSMLMDVVNGKIGRKSKRPSELKGKPKKRKRNTIPQDPIDSTVNDATAEPEDQMKQEALF